MHKRRWCRPRLLLLLALLVQLLTTMMSKATRNSVMFSTFFVVVKKQQANWTALRRVQQRISPSLSLSLLVSVCALFLCSLRDLCLGRISMSYVPLLFFGCQWLIVPILALCQTICRLLLHTVFVITVALCHCWSNTNEICLAISESEKIFLSTLRH